MQSLRFLQVKLDYKSKQGACHALDDLCFELHGGESIAIIGPSGCGKSSALRLAAGLIQASSGSVELDGAPLNRPRQQTALILQDFGLLPWKNVYKNAELGLKIRKVPRTKRREAVLHALSLVGLSDFQHAYPTELSGGQQQRLALARVLALDVDLLLMDEPLSALDALLREQMQELLLQLWRDQAYTQVLVTHSIEEAAYLGKRVFVMTPAPGKIKAVLQNPQAGTQDYRQSHDFYEMCARLRSLLASDTAFAKSASSCVSSEQKGSSYA